MHILPLAGFQGFALSLKWLLKRFSLFHSVKQMKTFSMLQKWPVAGSGYQATVQQQVTLFPQQGQKKWAQKMFISWELNFNICSLANESEVQVCSLLHSMNLESTPDPCSPLN